MLDQAVGGFLPRHVLGAHHVRQRFVHLAERRRSRDVVGAQGGDLVAHMGEIALVQNLAHVSLRNSSCLAPLFPCTAVTDPSAGENPRGRGSPRWVGRTRSSETAGALTEHTASPCTPARPPRSWGIVLND